MQGPVRDRFSVLLKKKVVVSGTALYTHITPASILSYFLFPCLTVSKTQWVLLRCSCGTPAVLLWCLMGAWMCSGGLMQPR